MAKITYEDKAALNINPDIPDTNKCNASDMNEIKQVVNENANINEYLTTEQVIGKWVDGKPVYRKVIHTTQAGLNIDLAHNINNISCVINKEIVSTLGQNTYFENNGTFTLKIKYANNSNVGIDIDDAFQGWNIYITLEYTKTTD